MDQQPALLRAVVEEPDDDMPRLIYADWLEERGDPRAEFIRVQCELAHLPDNEDRRADLEAREARLWVEHGKGWAGPIRRRVKGWTFRRGFVEGIKVHASTFLSRGEELFDLAPIRSVQLIGAAKEPNLLAASPLLERLRSLDLHDNFIVQGTMNTRRGSGRPNWRALYEAQQKARANAQRAGAVSLKVLLGSKYLGNLQELHLENNRLGAGGMNALLESDVLDRLTVLDLGRNDLGVEAVKALIDSRRLGSLRTLRLSYCRNEDPDYDAQDDAYSTLPAEYTNYDEENEWEYGPGGNYFPRGHLPRILAPLLGQLVELDLGACSITQTGVQDLAVLAPSLARFSLHHNFIGLAGSRALVDSPLLHRVTSLNLSSCYIDDRALKVLAAGPLLANVRRLELGNHDASADGYFELGSATFAKTLTHLGLAGSIARHSGGEPQGRTAAEALAGAASLLPQLTWLDLRKNGLTPEAARVLSASTLLPRLAWLDLRHNDLGDDGAQAFLSLGPWPRLARLDLRDNGIGPVMGRQLRQRFGPLVLYSTSPRSPKEPE